MKTATACVSRGMKKLMIDPIPPDFSELIQELIPEHPVEKISSNNSTSQEVITKAENNNTINHDNAKQGSDIKNHCKFVFQVVISDCS